VHVRKNAVLVVVIVVAGLLAGCSERFRQYDGTLSMCPAGTLETADSCINVPAIGGVVSLLVLLWLMRTVAATRATVDRIEKKLNEKRKED
jgi:hypothetical protein